MGSREQAAFPPHLLDDLDRSAFDRLCGSTEERRDHKLSYADLELWIARAWKDAKRLGLDASPPIDVLDIGMGPGYFVYVCQRLGHRAAGLDRPGFYPLWQGLRQWLGVTRVVEHTIKPNEKLPADLGRFDLVTSYRAQFNYLTEEKRLWTLAEWAFFLDNLRDQVLKPEGRFALRLAKQEHKGGEGLRRSDEELADFMAARGATQLKSVLLFDPLR
jgi:SAM-dependent methyltransferase